MKSLLCKRGACDKKRVQLFEASVSKSALWCGESWALTVKQKRQLRATQRAMLRLMFGPGRVKDEEYVPWIQRATRIAEERARRAGMQCWLRQQLKLKWRWAGKVSRMEDERWAKRTTTWRDSVWQAENSKCGTRPLRDRPGNRLRWEDELRRFAKDLGDDPWQTLALDVEGWMALSEQFSDWAWR